MLLRSLELHTSISFLNKIQFQHSIVLLFLLLIFLSHVNSSSVHPDIYIYSGCSQEKFEFNSPFQGSLSSFLQSVVSSSSQVSYNSYTIGNDPSSTAPEAALFGLYQCRGDLRVADCSRCIHSAVNQITILCTYSYGATLQLDGCELRYEHVSFLGKLDTNLMFKKCSNSSVENDVEFFKRRDDVLADLLTSVGFKVSSSGFVEGYAQCLGDLSSGDCSVCLAQAVNSLKNLCGSAAAADVFMGQCYARYWASGYYDDISSDSTDKEDGVGKTIAIAIGIVAGLAVLIVLLSICRKSVG